MGVKLLINGFNEACHNIAASYLMVGGESVSAIHFWTKAEGNLLHLSYIFHKTEPLGKEFNTVACSFTGAFLFIGVHRGNLGMKHSKYQQQLGSTVACTKRMMELTKGIDQRYIKGYTKYCFLFDSWFSSNNPEEASIKVGAGLIGMVKIYIKGF